MASDEPRLRAAIDAIAAEEGALKLKEATFKWAQGIALEQALHGPHAALRAGMGAVLLPPAGGDGGRFASLEEVCRKRGLAVVVLGVPDCGDALRPLAAAVPLQRLTAEIARLCGGDPDRSRLLP